MQELDRLTHSLLRRPRRNRRSPAIRSLVRETHLLPCDLVQPYFILPGEKRLSPICEMPGIDRLSIDLLLKEVEPLHAKGLQAIALFPCIENSLKCPEGKEALNPFGLIPQAIKMIKKELPSLCIITDIALDPYTSHGHDGLIDEYGYVLNDLTVETLCRQALVQAEAGCDIIAPSDMMDGRVRAIRQTLDSYDLQNVGILSYTAKYASSLYSPFRGALQSSLKLGDKKSYQMDPANSREALLEASLDEEEGADILMVKPASLYLDIISKLREKTTLPIAAYHVSGEYTMVMAAANYIDPTTLFHETLLAIKRAGADIIFSYASKRILQNL